MAKLLDEKAATAPAFVRHGVAKTDFAVSSAPDRVALSPWWRAPTSQVKANGVVFRSVYAGLIPRPIPLPASVIAETGSAAGAGVDEDLITVQ
ncbi:hypothetical protein VMT40_31185 [Nocardia sp. CDC160]|nr:hypothetical protein [Nocardia sp. CDC160]